MEILGPDNIDNYNQMFLRGIYDKFASPVSHFFFRDYSRKL